MYARIKRTFKAMQIAVSFCSCSIKAAPSEGLALFSAQTWRCCSSSSIATAQQPSLNKESNSYVIAINVIYVTCIAG